MEAIRSGGRDDLLREAERLFGSRGVESVTLRDIVRAAGHKNESAVQYHFGSKQRLVDAVVAVRLRRIEKHRLALLHAIEADDATRDAARLLAAIVQPLMDEVLNKPGGGDYIAFLAQAIARPGFDIVALVAELDLPGMIGITRHLRAAAGRVPPAVQHMRERMAIIAMVAGLAGWVADSAGISRARLERELVAAGQALLVPNATSPNGSR